jgi:hypothetical protein
MFEVREGREHTRRGKLRRLGEGMGVDGLAAATQLEQRAQDSDIGCGQKGRGGRGVHAYRMRPHLNIRQLFEHPFAPWTIRRCPNATPARKPPRNAAYAWSSNVDEDPWRTQNSPASCRLPT